MANQVGKKYSCEKCGATYIVTRGGEGEIICCGQPMQQKQPISNKSEKARRDNMSQLGKRYQCEDCGTVVLCTKASDCDPTCCEKGMEVQQPKKKPSSD